MTTLNDDDDFTIIDGKKVLKDGRKITVPAFLRDAASADDGQLHRPGQRTSNDAAGIERRATAYEGYERDLTDAWRTPDAAPVTTDDKKPIADARESAHAGYVNDLANAWKGAA